MSNPKKPQLQAQIQLAETKETSRKSEFRLPAGYRLGWGETHSPDGKKIGWHVLRNQHGEEIGHFEFVLGETAEAVLMAHCEIAVVVEERKAIITLVDDKGTEVGSCVRHEDRADPADTADPIAILMQYLTNRPIH